MCICVHGPRYTPPFSLPNTADVLPHFFGPQSDCQLFHLDAIFSCRGLETDQLCLSFPPVANFSCFSNIIMLRISQAPSSWVMNIVTAPRYRYPHRSLVSIIARRLEWLFFFCSHPKSPRKPSVPLVCCVFFFFFRFCRRLHTPFFMSFGPHHFLFPDRAEAYAWLSRCTKRSDLSLVGLIEGCLILEALLLRVRGSDPCVRTWV